MRRSLFIFPFLISVAVVAGAIGLSGTAEPVAMAPAVTVTAEPAAAAQSQTASGKVKSVTASSLTIEAQEGGETRQVDFVLNADTQVEGELQAGARVEVAYRVEDGQNIAARVRVVA
jgi:hypothetical protein